jgi:hypothetical protein
VIILVGSSPPHESDAPVIRRLVDEWHARGGVISTIDVSRLLHEEHEKKLHRWLYGEELKEATPLPEFYRQVQESFAALAREGGGEMVSLEDSNALVRQLLVLTFGPRWEKDMARIARGL